MQNCTWKQLYKLRKIFKHIKVWLIGAIVLFGCNSESTGFFCCCCCECVFFPRRMNQKGGDRWVVLAPFIPVLNLPEHWRGSRTKPSFTPGGFTGLSVSHRCLGIPCQDFSSWGRMWNLNQHFEWMHEVCKMCTFLGPNKFQIAFERCPFSQMNFFKLF